MRRNFRVRGALLLLLLATLAGCGGSGTSIVLVPPPTAVTATVAVAVAPSATPTPSVSSPAATASPTPAPALPSPTATTRPVPTPTSVLGPPSTSAAPSAAPAATSTILPTRSPTRPPAPTATAPRPTVAAVATATQPPAPTATRVPATAAPVAKARAIDRGPSTRRMIALTFDAGADRGYAARILDTLRDTGVKATFGMTGKWAEQNPDLIQRMVAEGHQLMNHTYDHASFTGYSPGTAPLTAEERRREIARTEAVISAAAGVELKPYFRPPYGDYDDAMLTQLGQLGYRYSVMWTVDSLGWNGRTAAQIVQRCVDGAVPGAILLFHVGAASQDAAALPELIRQLKAANYTFGTIEELLS